MPDHPTQDRKLGLKRVGYLGRWVTEYSPELAARIVEKIAEGLLLRDICDPTRGEFPHPTTFMRWVVLHPELTKAYNAAVEFSARAFEEEAIETARLLARKPGTAQNVRANEVLINQLRWSSERRDPARFGAQRTAVFRVPIQINTTLDLNTGLSATGTNVPQQTDVYNITAEVEQEVPDTPSERPLLAGPKYDPKAPRKKVLRPPGKSPFKPKGSP